MTSISVRAAKLAVLAGVRSAGVAPWAIAVAWIGIAKAQEPTILRSFGVHLTEEAAVLSACALSLVLSGSAPSARGTAARILRNAALALLATGGCALAAGLSFLADQQAGSALLAPTLTTVAINTLSTMCYESRWQDGRSRFWLVCAVVQSAVAFAVGIRVLAVGWSTSVAIASIAGLAAAMTSTTYAGDKT
jgi:hypothetical protein